MGGSAAADSGAAATSEVAVARPASASEVVDWNELVAANPGGGEVWAGEEYLEAKRHGRYLPRRVMVDRPGRSALAVGVLAKRVPVLGEWWHLPAGPPGEDLRAVLEATAAVGELARRHGAFMLKIEPRLPAGAAADRALRATGAIPSVRIVPNPSTVLVDVTGTEQELFARLGKKARNSITRAARDGIEVRRVPASDENCAAFSRLLRETADGRFVLREERYYREFWQRFEHAGNGQLFFATSGGELVAGAFAIALGDKTTYKDGASLREKRAYGASHALQWEVLRWANERGARVHDLCGAPPSDRADDPGHPLHGVGRFKRSFQSETTDYVGAFDVPLKPAAYRAWASLGDRLARRWSLAVRKDPYY